MIYKVELKDETKETVVIDAATIAITDGGVLGFVNDEGFIIRAFGEKEWKEVWLANTRKSEKREEQEIEIDAQIDPHFPITGPEIAEIEPEEVADVESA